jgi:hypothetical protein
LISDGLFQENIMTNSDFFTPVRLAALLLIAATSLFTAGATVSPAENIAQAGEDDSAELAKKLTNPLSDLIIVPLENNFEFGGGPKDDGFRYTLKVQPVLPLSLNEHWNLISRTIIPIIDQHDMIGTTHQSGLGDVLQSMFFSPKAPTHQGWIWGAGPVLLLPTATDDLLGVEKFAIGPTAIVLRQTHGWTYGMLFNHLWSVAGNGNRQDVSAAYLQPILDYTTKHHTTFGLSSESSYDWKRSQWTVPCIVNLSQLVKIGKLPLDLKLSGRYYVERPDGAPDWGLRFTVTFLFPK